MKPRASQRAQAEEFLEVVDAPAGLQALEAHAGLVGLFLLDEVSAMRRRMAKFCAPSPRRMRHSSSLNVTSSTQLQLFSMPQWARTLALNSPASACRLLT